MSAATVADAARTALALDICVLPPKEDGSKMPIVEQDPKTHEWGWKQWQERRPTPTRVEQWYSNARTGLGLVCGAISGNLELLDFDDRATYDRFKAAAIAIGLGDLVERIEAGYLEETPNGTHWFYRCSEIEGNQKLARRVKRPDEQNHASDNIKGLIETRGEGGYGVIAPSHGKVHPSGRAYQRLRGELATIATITPDERAELFQLARSFDELPRPEVREPVVSAPSSTQDGDRPGDVFNARADWATDVLQPNGWLLVHTAADGEQFWLRPGGKGKWSATVNYGGRDLLHVFTTSTGLDPERSYTKFSAFSILTHGGDFKAAARAAAERFDMGQGPVWNLGPTYAYKSSLNGTTGRLDADPATTIQPEAPPLWSPSVLLDEDERQAAARDTFLDLYIDYASSRTSAPAEFHEAVGLAALSAGVGRRAVLRLATGDVYPMIWVMIVAESTIYHKSTALDIGREVVRMVNENLLAPNDFTPQRFLAIMAEHDGNPLLFFRDEVAGFYEAMNRLEFMSGLKESLCNVYDGRAFRREKQKPKASKDGTPPPDAEWKYDLKEPFLSMAVATTAERFFEVAQTNDLHSGFLPRYAMVVPQGPPPKDHDLRALDLALDAARRIVVMKLGAIMNRPANLTCSKEALDRLTRYGRDITHEAQAAPDRNMTNIVGSRIQWMAMRVAMLLAVADGSLRVDLPHLYRGIEIAEGWRHTALRMMSALAPSKFERSAVRLVDLVERKGARGISRRDAMRALKFNKREIDDLQTTLAERGELRVIQIAQSGAPTFWYYPVGPLSPLSPLSPGPLDEATSDRQTSYLNSKDEESIYGRNGQYASQKGSSDNRDNGDNGSGDNPPITAERSLDDLFDEAVWADGGAK